MPPPQRRPVDDRGLGELGRGMDALSDKIDSLTAKIDGLSHQYTPREVHDLAVGGVKIDIRRLDEEREKGDKRAEKTDEKVTALEAEINRRFRQAVTLTITALIGPLTVAVVIYALSQMVGR